MAYDHYTDYLVEEKLERTLRNPTYSLRAFARSLELSPGFLNLLLQKKRALSFDRAMAIVQKINWPADKSYGFLELVRQQSHQKIPAPSKISSVLFSTRDKMYKGEGSLYRLEDGAIIPYRVEIKVSKNRIFTSYAYANGDCYDLDFKLRDKGNGTFILEANDQPIGEGFFVDKICHVDFNFMHPKVGPFHASVPHVFSGNKVTATGRNFSRNTTFHQVAAAVRSGRKSV